MEYLQLYAEDENEENMEMDKTIVEENAQDRDFIDDNVSFSSDSSFYRTVDNNIELVQNIDKDYIKKDMMSAEDNREWLANPNDQVENYTYNALTNPEYDDFDDEKNG